MHVEETPSVPGLAPELLPEPPEPVELPVPELPLELLKLPLLLPLPPPPPDADPELPQAHAPTTRTSDADPTSAARRAGEVRSFMTFLRGGDVPQSGSIIRAQRSCEKPYETLVIGCW